MPNLWRRGDLEYNPLICQIHSFLITFGALRSVGLCTGLNVVVVNNMKYSIVFMI
ncbi:hypothetical protein BJ741DRAFT_648042, partial [Chytriomyces cf. hyalinus JEL632]